MSHRSQVQTKMTNLDIVKKAIKALGLSYYEGEELAGRYTSRWTSEEKKADIIIDIENRKDIGIRKDAQGFYNLVGDFYGLSLGQKGLTDKVLQMYNVEFTKDFIENTSEHGITSYTTVTLPNGDIVLEGEIDEEQIVTA